MKWIGGIYNILTLSFIQSMEMSKRNSFFFLYLHFFGNCFENNFFFTKNWHEIMVIIKMCLSSHQILLHICYKMITPAYCIDIYTCNKHIKINRARIHPPSPNLIFIILNQTLKFPRLLKKNSVSFLVHILANVFFFKCFFNTSFTWWTKARVVCMHSQNAYSVLDF